MMYNIARLHSDIFLQDWKNYVSIVRSPSHVAIDGHQLTLSGVVAVARNYAPASLTEESRLRLENSVNALHKRLREGETIYGVNTGFGGSADTRTTKLEDLQHSLLRELHFGVLIPSSGSSSTTRAACDPLTQSLDVLDSQSTTCMPLCWTRAAIVVRMNSLAAGYSAVRVTLLERMQDLLAYNIIPRVPMRGSISASGDLSPLSYIGAAIQAKPVEVWAGRDPPKITTARVAFADHGLSPTGLLAKEALAIVNGTATSCGVAALALHDMNGLAVLSQILTAMSVEALRGSTESFDPFPAQVRPHPGQYDAARNIRAFLQGSKLVRDGDDETGGLRQDRYSIRTASQWLGPVLEDLVLSHEQLKVECNSVTDNPLFDHDGRSIHSGNFQANTVASAMEKARHGAHTIGRMLFAQCTEMINPATSRGLPQNLVADDCSLSFMMKSVDLSVAALVSELGFLAHAVNHIQTAEMGNQSINSLALISARYTHTATEVLSMLVASHLLAVCQALDLRAMHARFFDRVEPEFRILGARCLAAAADAGSEHTMQAAATDIEAEAHSRLWSKFQTHFEATSQMPLDQRTDSVASILQSIMLDEVSARGQSISHSAFTTWRRDLSLLAFEEFTTNRQYYFSHGDASDILGSASKRIYNFIRKDLEIPLLRIELLRSPFPEPVEQIGEADSTGIATPPTEPEEAGALTIGSQITKIHQAIRNGVLLEPAMACIELAQS